MSRYINTRFPWKNITQYTRNLSNTNQPTTLTTHNSCEEEETDSQQQVDTSPPAIRYNVCRDRTAAQKFVFAKVNNPGEEEEKRKPPVQEMEETQSKRFDPPPAITDRPSNGYRTFDASKTYKNVVLPLKSSKLANPFPEPVKMMPSHTVSDQEKADQMAAERRVPFSLLHRAKKA